MVVGDMQTRAIMKARVVRGIPSDVQQLALRRLRILGNVGSLCELHAIPALRLRRRCRSSKIVRYALALSRGWELRFEWRRGRPMGVVLAERWPLKVVARC